MPKRIILVLLFLPIFGSAQHQDYLILHKGDTIKGKYISLNSKYTRFRTDAGKIKMSTADVKEFYWKKNKYKVLEDPCEGGMSSYKVLIDGKVAFLFSGGYEDYCPELLVIEDKIYPVLRKRHFSEDAWNILATCPAFREKYKDYFNERRNKTIIWEWAYRKSRTKILEMISDYNKNCGQIRDL